MKTRWIQVEIEYEEGWDTISGEELLTSGDVQVALDCMFDNRAFFAVTHIRRGAEGEDEV